MSKAKSTNDTPTKPCLSRQNFHLSITAHKVYSVLNPFLYPHENEERNFPNDQKSDFALFVQIS